MWKESASASTGTQATTSDGFEGYVRREKLYARDVRFNEINVYFTVEWAFKELKQYFTMLELKRNIQSLKEPLGKLYRLEMLLTNMQNCLYNISI